jgi:hypothetical protein
VQRRISRTLDEMRWMLGRPHEIADA